jgi:hypothetical protein
MSKKLDLTGRGLLDKPIARKRNEVNPSIPTNQTVKFLVQEKAGASPRGATIASFLVAGCFVPARNCLSLALTQEFNGYGKLLLRVL